MSDLATHLQRELLRGLRSRYRFQLSDQTSASLAVVVLRKDLTKLQATALLLQLGQLQESEK